ncbi:MAG: glycosyltransferase family 9 protein [Flavobacterium sp.]|nr:glycosyltransferase family 9 protein [Flavobacterium sp.]
MGDVAMTVPVIRAVVEQNPDVKVTFISRPFYKPFFDGINNVTFFDVDLNNRHKGLLGIFNLYADLKKLNINAFVDLHNVIRSKIIRNLFSLSGTKVAFTDKGRTEKKVLTRSKNKIFKPLQPVISRYATTFIKLNIKVDLTQPNIPDKAILSEKIVSITGNKGNLKWIGIAPFAQYESKVYPKDLMQKVINELSINNNKIFLFGGGKKEIEILNQFSRDNKNCIVIAGKLNLKEELELISNLDVMLSMDSGNGHIAAMLGVKVITLWGSTHPHVGFAPFNQPFENFLTADRIQFPLIPTSVYGNINVSGYENAMRTITVEEIISKINKI